MNTAFETLIGIVLLAFVILPPTIGLLRERGIDRQLRAGAEAREQGGVTARNEQVSSASQVAEACRAGLFGPSHRPGLRH
ncbi:hypothetical protein [Streptomyces albidus (ex Kaewkla and Franco 2022)]|uniref:hypothetical protein n=1 Tax=Streptomyces albidus (ex Kaewkla and Franco 2022) TaxID=722709 RepID=UPI0015EF5FA6|nr:hypothetical protein [Streptomyces albidus (ex Kaewkla and Franco 2022)]